MHERQHSRLIAYVVAVLGPLLIMLIRGASMPVLDERARYIIFCPAVLIAAYLGGLAPGLVASLVSAAAIKLFLIPPHHSFWIESEADALALGCFVLVGVLISGLSESLHRSRQRVAASQRHYAVTLSSIGDAVIATDTRARVTFLNRAAEALTGWALADAVGQPLTEVFRIVHEQTRQPVESPATKVLRLGTVVGLANHTALFTRDGREVPIDDCGAPIVDEHDAIAGVVLVFRDVTQRRKAEEAEALRLANERLELALRGSSVGIWDIDMPDGDLRNGRIYYVNVWEQLGYERPDSPKDQQTGMALVHPDDRVAHAEATRRYLAGETEEFEVESRVWHKDGSYRWMISRGVAVRDAGGKPIRFLGTGIDITDRKRAEEALHQANARVELAVRSSGISIWECDMPDGRIENAHLTVFNVWESLGYDARTMPTDFSSASAAFFHPDDLERVGHEIQELLAGDGRDWKNEYRALTKDGSTRWLLARGTVLRDADGKPIRFIGTSTDITDRKQAEEALRESEERFSRLAKATNDAVWDLDLSTNKVWWNEGVHTLFGYRLEEDRAHLDWWLERVHPEDRAAVEAFFFEVVHGTELTWVDEYRFRCADGSYKDVYDRGYVLRSADGQAMRMIGAMLDITGRKRAEEAMRLSEQRYRSLIEATAAIVWTLPASGVADKSEQPSWSAFTGQSSDQFAGWGWLDCIHPDDRDQTFQSWTSAVAAGALYQIEYRVRRHDGTYRNMLTRGVPILATDGTIREWFGTCIDITEFKQLEEELRQAKETAEAANRAKDEFLANVSHEIRTPMNAILGMTELALDSELSEYQQQCLTTVKAAAENLLTIINDLLDFAKIEAGKLELDLTDFPLRSTVGETLRSLAVRAHKKALELIYDVHPDVPEALVGDAGRLRQILLNLVGNAIKFTDHGEVVVRVDMDYESGAVPPNVEKVRLRFTVRDTGIGIPRDNQERIFHAFEQEDTSTTRRYGGTGLGLTISARLVALMDGRIMVQSESNVGSTFTFTATFSRQTKPTPKETVRPQIKVRDLRALVVDDNATNRRILEEWLQDWQMKPTTVSDGVTALDAILQGAANGTRYELILLDSQMPKMDGLELAAKIRALPGLQRPRIILLTSGERVGDLSRVRELQINAYLLKPIEQEQLLETIIEVMSQDEEEFETAKPPIHDANEQQPVSSRSLSVLVAEDNEFNVELLQQLLSRRGHHVRIATDGRQALTAVQGEQFDLLLLDVHMPEMDGFQVAEKLREHERQIGGHLPVIALTARSRKEDREQCLAAGMDDFLAKPIRSAELWATIDRLVVERRSEGQGSSDLLTAKVLLSACGGNGENLAKLCHAFQGGLPGYMNALRDAFRDGEVARLREAAHKLCGMLGTFSTQAGSLASQIEDLAAVAQIEECGPLVDHLEQMSQELLKQLEGISIEKLRKQLS